MKYEFLLLFFTMFIYAQDFSKYDCEECLNNQGQQCLKNSDFT